MNGESSYPTTDTPPLQQHLDVLVLGDAAMPFGEAQNKFKTAAEAGKGAPDILRAEVAWVPEMASL